MVVRADASETRDWKDTLQKKIKSQKEAYDVDRVQYAALHTNEIK